MKCRGLCRGALFLGMVLLAATVGIAATKAKPKEYVPKEGQDGKDVVWIPTRNAVADKMLDLAQVTAKDFVIDLGSGDGRLVIAAAKRGARALGIEYNPGLVELANRNAIAEGVADKTRFVKADIFESDFSQATVITMFLLLDLNLKLRPQLLKLKPGTRIVSNTFGMGEWTADQAEEVGGYCSLYCTALLWIVPAQVDGEWSLSGGGQLTLTQSFQMIAFNVIADGKTIPIESGRLTGDRIAFTAGGAEYSGRVRGSAMQGEYKSGGTRGTWSAVRSASR
ncbi:MAG: class I SAM-dependent methyltransferase [Syntrophaceae bacterium]|nr:class I SAM-dependent methyltransferase [Syntrophaceae bacterium]